MDEQPVGLFDMDGTLCDYEGALRKDLALLRAPSEPDYPDPLDDGIPHLKARMDLIKSQPGWWRNLPRHQPGFDVMEVAHRLGFELEIVTKGPRKNRRAWTEKAEWIDDNLGPEVTVNVLGRNKGRYYGLFLCDDYEEYMADWLRHRPRGLGILIDNPRNRQFAHENVVRYDGTNLTAVEEHLLAVLKRRPHEHWRGHLGQ